MSVEALVIAALVEEGSIKKAFQNNIGAHDFEEYDEEFQWLLDRTERKRPITPRLFKKQFPDFDFVLPRESLGDLLEELKQDRAFVSITSALDELISGDVPLEPDNALVKAQQLREILGEVLRTHSAHSDVLIKGQWEEHLQQAKELQLLRQNGDIPGIPTGIRHFDHHFGGWQDETSYLVLGRPGDAKSSITAVAAVEGAWNGYRVGFFSPEMTEKQHRARFYTYLSAKPDVQIALGLKGAFRNRALKDGHGYNIKKFGKFLQWLEQNLTGEIVLFTQKYRREKMTPQYIETRIEELGLDMAIIDPIYKLKSPRNLKDRWQELQLITDSLVDISHSFNIPILMTNQASRALVGRKGEAPDKDSSFGADAPVQEADCVFGVKHHSEERIMKVNCSKNRHGEQFKFTMKFHPNIGIMEDVTPISNDYFNGYDPEKAEELREALKEAE